MSFKDFKFSQLDQNAGICFGANEHVDEKESKVYGMCGGGLNCSGGGGMCGGGLNCSGGGGRCGGGLRCSGT